MKNQLEMRLFIAINFSADTKNGLIALGEEIRAQAECGRFSLPENLHLTLAFLGGCDTKQFAAAKAAMDMTPFEPFDIVINRIGCFMRKQRDNNYQRDNSYQQGNNYQRGVRYQQDNNYQQSNSYQRDNGCQQDTSHVSAIWWAGVQQNKDLQDLQGRLTDRLVAAGFSLDKRKYDPHITLGREVVSDITPRPIEPFGETVSGIDLMKSEHINGKLTYTPVYRRGNLVKI